MSTAQQKKPDFVKYFLTREYNDFAGRHLPLILYTREKYNLSSNLKVAPEQGPSI